MVQKQKRLPGRPRHFDVDDALDRALGVFWGKGYEAASIDDLTEAMGISRPSLYNAYGDKEALFQRCLDRYCATSGALSMSALVDTDGVRNSVSAYLRQAAINSSGECTPSGCFVMCILPGSGFPGASAFLRASFADSERRVAERLAAGVASGELPQDFPVASRARSVIDASMSIAIRARSGAPRSELLQSADDAASLALSHSE